MEPPGSMTMALHLAVSNRLDQLQDAILAGEPADVIQSHLAWRGPQGEYVDPRQSSQNPSGRVARLIRHGDDPRQFPSLNHACHLGRLDIVALLLQWRGPRGEYVRPWNTVLFEAVSNHHVDVVSMILAWRCPTTPPPAEEAGGKWFRLDMRAEAEGSLLYADDDAVMVQTLLSWRGPGGEYLDPRPTRALTLSAWRRFDGVTETLLTWRGHAEGDMCRLDDWTRVLAIFSAKPDETETTTPSWSEDEVRRSAVFLVEAAVRYADAPTFPNPTSPLYRPDLWSAAGLESVLRRLHLNSNSYSSRTITTWAPFRQATQRYESGAIHCLEWMGMSRDVIRGTLAEYLGKGLTTIS